MHRNRRKEASGFTLIELLIIIGIIGFLAAAILVAVDPVKRIQDARNAKRWAEVNGILNAILTKQVDARALYDGETSAPIITGSLAQVIVSDDSTTACSVPATAPACPPVAPLDVTVGKKCVANLSALVPDYLAELPVDALGAGTVPTAGNLALGPKNTGYYIHRTTGNRLEIGACYPDGGTTIQVKR